jgi:hypothetical protein
MSATPFSTVSTQLGHRPACSDEAVSVAKCIAAKLFAQEDDETPIAFL